MDSWVQARVGEWIHGCMHGWVNEFMIICMESACKVG